MDLRRPATRAAPDLTIALDRAAGPVVPRRTICDDPPVPDDGPTPPRETVPWERLPYLERFGVEYVKRLSRSLPELAADAEIHILDARERAALRGIERRAVLRSGLAGALSALVSVAGIVWADHSFPVAAVDPAWAQRALYWGVVFGVAGGAAVLEMVFLYRDALRHTLMMARAAGLPLFDEDDDRVDRELAGGLVRAALELQNPARTSLGVDPLREASRWRLVAYSLLYKGKVAVTSFLLKMLVRRAMGRAVVRGAVVELVAVPVTAAWNAAVTWLTLREARLRILGPSAAATLVGELWEEDPDSPQRQGALRAVASAMVRSRDLHPNIVSLLHEVRERLQPDDEGEADALDDTGRFLDHFSAASPDEQRWIHAVAVLAAILDGKLVAPERRLLQELRGAMGISTSLRDVRQLARRFKAGQPVRAAELYPPDQKS